MVDDDGDKSNILYTTYFAHITSRIVSNRFLPTCEHILFCIHIEDTLELNTVKYEHKHECMRNSMMMKIQLHANFFYFLNNEFFFLSLNIFKLEQNRCSLYLK